MVQQSLLKMLVIVILVSVSFTLIQAYSREEVQRYYEWFGSDRNVFFPDENNDPILDFYENYLEKYINFEYYSRESALGIPITNLADLSTYVNISKPTKIVIHGWRSSGKNNYCILIKNGFLFRYDANVLIMDWSEIFGFISYLITVVNIKTVGKLYGKYLNYLVDEVKVDPHDIHLVGHSLGAHISGLAGREVKNGKIGRITGLDPALPLIDSEVLQKSDASFVDVIHTCAGYLGFKINLGHADFYPNGGGPPQPGCDETLGYICSHTRSWNIYASSLFDDVPLMATQCLTLDDVKEGKNCHGYQVPIGELTPANASGIFYVEILDTDLIYTNESYK